jgi:hypothetical protein
MLDGAQRPSDHLANADQVIRGLRIEAVCEIVGVPTKRARLTLWPTWCGTFRVPGNRGMINGELGGQCEFLKRYLEDTLVLEQVIQPSVLGRNIDGRN